MKRTFALSLVLVLLGPWFALLCSCCPMVGAAPAETPTLSAADCDCCGVPTLIEAKKEGMLNSLESLSFIPPHRMLYPAVAANLLETQIVKAGGLFSQDAGPPVSFSETPLYLSLQVLRL